MKTKITTIASWFLALLTTSIFAQIPNNGFENWVTLGNGEDPAGWHTTNLFDTTGTYFPIIKSTDHYPVSAGNFSMSMQNNISLLPAFNAYGIAMTTRLDGSDRPLFPITGHPDSLYGYYKFTSVNSDTMNINVYLYNNSVEIVGAHFIASQSTSGWTSFKLPIPAYVNADSARITIMSCNLEGAGAQGNSVLYVDNLSFDSLIVAGTEDPILAGYRSVYPNPAKNEITVEERMIDSQSNVFISNISGQLLQENKLINNKTTIDISNLGSGIYILKLQNEKTVGVFKVIKE